MTLHERFKTTKVGNHFFASSTIAPPKYQYPINRSTFKKSPEEVSLLKTLKREAFHQFTIREKLTF